MRIVFIIIGACLTLCTSCTEFISPNVSSSHIPIISPSDSLYTSSGTITFWWEASDSIERYKLQVVSPGFNNPVLLFDTMLSGDRLSLLLDEGIYQWRIQAKNASSSSAWQNRSFVIDQTVPETPDILYPLPGDTLGRTQDTLALRWNSADKPVSGTRFPVRDSLYIYDASAPVRQLLGAFEYRSPQPGVLKRTFDLSAISIYQTIECVLRSFDECGNFSDYRSITIHFK